MKIFNMFSPGESKNWGIDINHCSVDYQRKLVDCYDKNIILTYRIMMQHHPHFSEVELQAFNGMPAPLFLRPKLKVKKSITYGF